MHVHKIRNIKTDQKLFKMYQNKLSVEPHICSEHSAHSLQNMLVNKTIHVVKLVHIGLPFLLLLAEASCKNFRAKMYRYFIWLPWLLHVLPACSRRKS